MSLRVEVRFLFHRGLDHCLVSSVCIRQTAAVVCRSSSVMAISFTCLYCRNRFFALCIKVKAKKVDFGQNLL